MVVPQWLVGLYGIYKWMMTGGAPILGNPHISSYI